MIRWIRLVAVPIVAVAATGCLATKGDIRLLQDELMKSRAQLARADSAQRVTSDSLAMAISALAIAQGRGDESLMQAQLKFVARTDSGLRALTTKLSTLEINTREQFKAQHDLIDQVMEMARQNAKTSAATRASVEQATARANATPPTPGDSTSPPPTSGAPGSATLLQEGKSAAYGGSCSTARRNFNAVLTQFPNSPDAPEALYYIADTYSTCDAGRNPVTADSVYQLVTLRYPTNDRAADALYKRAELARTVFNKPDDAQKLYQRVVCEYPRSAVVTQAKDKLTTPGRCK